jgi:hypothetical protein
VDVYSFGAAYLGPSYTPFNVPGDPSEAGFSVKNLSVDQSASERLDDRTSLLKGFDRLRRSVDDSGIMNAMDQFNQQALTMLTSDQARNAFDLSQESDALRDRYGRHAWGQRALMARRLVEAGCSFVTMVMENPYQSGVEWLKAGTYNWDSHAVNCDIVVTGEFGRTPRVNSQTGTQTGVSQPGRDHWPQAMSMLLAGGGMRTGQVVGSTNAKGEEPKERPLTPNDLWATVYRHLGIDWTQSFLDHSGRPMPILPFGDPISELLPVS